MSLLSLYYFVSLLTYLYIVIASVIYVIGPQLLITMMLFLFLVPVLAQMEVKSLIYKNIVTMFSLIVLITERLLETKHKYNFFFK